MQAPSSIERSYTVRNSDADFLQELKPSSLLSFFQEAAGDHAKKMGLGFGLLSEKGCFWVLSKVVVAIDSVPHCGERLFVQTWPHLSSRAIYERSFCLRGEESCVRALSRWCVLEASGRIVPSSQISCTEMDYDEGRACTVDDWRIAETDPGRRAVYSTIVANSDYDLNMHVSNLKYADHVFNCFSVEELCKHTLKGFALHFVRQAYEGDTLLFYREDLPGGMSLVTGKRDGNETVVAARINFGRDRV